ncbi:hypothetical protein LOZ57_005881 [Ophidiomyces ophidiicola]|uniref:uncharacterized protein n=1 Tax=Ophidiomyces ophidiicola TaxID=1387563 RepID=UPI0020C47F87|nr:uncharacterized protein LOZ57_005881 [Ophidiomyces ophidiicola]KAI1940738.1 hypothetical protein LOZ57_005881 [Ophidiomyces ophidiicola]
MGPRRSHRKSRLGCQQCKRRKIKCDEAPPPCANCRKHNIACSFAPPSSSTTAAAARTTPTTTTTTTTTASSSSAPLSPLSPPTTTTTTSSPPADALHLPDLELLHHYTAHTYRTLSYNNEHKAIWKHYIPREALSHPFLMHGLLALAALHLAAAAPPAASARYTERATRHQDRALAAFRPQLAAITPANCHAVFAFSSLTAALAFAFARSARHHRPASAPAEPVTQVLHDFFLFRGVERVLTTFWDLIRQGCLGPLVHRPADPARLRPLPADVAAALDYLHACNAAAAAAESAAYDHALRELRVSFERAPTSWESVFRWPVVVPDAYLAHLKARRPMALVILAHYCVILRRLDACWWSQGWSGQLLEAIFRSLDVAWRPLLQWPVHTIGLADKLADIP